METIGYKIASFSPHWSHLGGHFFARSLPLEAVEIAIPRVPDYIRCTLLFSSIGDYHSCGLIFFLEVGSLARPQHCLMHTTIFSARC
jgi:hypothetical protein